MTFGKCDFSLFFYSGCATTLFCCRRTCASGVRRCWIIVCVACSDSRPPWQEFLLVAFTVGILSPFLFLAVADPMKTPAVSLIRQLADDPNAPVTNAVLSAEIVQVDKLAMEEMMPFSTVVLTIFQLCPLLAFCRPYLSYPLVVDLPSSALTRADTTRLLIAMQRLSTSNSSMMSRSRRAGSGRRR